jgi:hypothetical protein
LLATGQIRDLAVRKRQHVNLVQASACHLAVLPGGSPHQSKPTVTSHQDHVHDANREIPIHRFALRDITDPAHILFERLPEHLDPAATDRHEAHDRLDQRGFAGTIRADNANQFSGGHGQIDAPQHRFAVIGDRQIVDLERRSDRLRHTPHRSVDFCNSLRLRH